MGPVALLRSLIHAMGAGAYLSTEEFRKQKYLILFVLQTVLGQPSDSESIRYRGTAQQALMLMNGRDIVKNFTSSSPRLSKILESRAPMKRIEAIYRTLLIRPPSPDEMERALKLVGARENDVTAYEDLYWVLVNSSEFFFIR
jgi:hypothetical protein